MPFEETSAITLENPNGTVTSGSLVTAYFTKNDRMKNAFVRGLGGLAGTIVVLFIPLAHFILVPLGLVITATLVSKALNQESVILSGLGTCPFCSELMTISKRKSAYPFLERCESCSRESTVKKAGTSTASLNL